VENNREDDGRCQNELAVTMHIRSLKPLKLDAPDNDETGDPLAPVKRAYLGSDKAKRRFKFSMNRLVDI